MLANQIQTTKLVAGYNVEAGQNGKHKIVGSTVESHYFIIGCPDETGTVQCKSFSKENRVARGVVVKFSGNMPKEGTLVAIRRINPSVLFEIGGESIDWSIWYNLGLDSTIVDVSTGEEYAWESMYARTTINTDNLPTL